MQKLVKGEQLIRSKDILSHNPEGDADEVLEGVIELAIEGMVVGCVDGVALGLADGVALLLMVYLSES